MNIKISHLIIVLAVILILISLHNNTTIEGYYGLTPYKYHWNIFKCLTSDCLIKESYNLIVTKEKLIEAFFKVKNKIKLVPTETEFVNNSNYTRHHVLILAKTLPSTPQ